MKNAINNKIGFALIIFFSLFVFSTGHSFAQSAGSFFDLTSPALSQKITASTHKTTQPVNISPFATVIVSPDSFTSDVNMYVYKGIWDRIKHLLPSDQSPIASYYLVFKDANNRVVSPKTPLMVQTINNYIGTNTYFYPVNASGIDLANQQERIGHVTLNVRLPINDNGFISAVNKTLDQNDSSLNPVFISTTPTPAFVQTAQTPLGFLSSLFPIIGMLILIIIAISILLIVRKRRKK